MSGTEGGPGTGRGGSVYPNMHTLFCPAGSDQEGLHIILPAFLTGGPGPMLGVGSAAAWPVPFLAQKLDSVCDGLGAGGAQGKELHGGLLSPTPLHPSKRGVWPHVDLCVSVSQALSAELGIYGVEMATTSLY